MIVSYDVLGPNLRLAMWDVLPPHRMTSSPVLNTLLVVSLAF